MKKLYNILLIDDDPSLIIALKRALENPQYKIKTASTYKEAKENYTKEYFDLALVDLFLPDNDGFQILSDLQNTNTLSIMLSGHADIDSAIESTKRGAFHFIKKPFHLKEMLSLVDKAIKQIDLQIENTKLKNSLKNNTTNIIGNSPKILKVLELAKKLSEVNTTTLITGKSGTGKELIARYIHNPKNSQDDNFYAINCASLPPDLLESKLFGHTKGSFTGALNQRKGLFELATGGTLLLDEIGDMPLNLQVKLLRVLQEKEFSQLGSNKKIKTNLRILTATHIDLKKAIAQKKFREDLYYRLNIIPVNIPNLKDRPTDIPLLINYFLTKFIKQYKKPKIDISISVTKQLMDYNWPGNIRELENLIERLVVLQNSPVILLKHLPEEYLVQSENKSIKINISKDGVNLKNHLFNYERQWIIEALKVTGGNKNQAAKLLQINRTTLIEKIKKMQIHATLPCPNPP
ncbi:MAG: sigma-54-dependent Fis family transcriptional regulator, partial [Bdellovibrionales bacterium]|nr:sigma-54-dependent Fis family transcriptional regulator [Bdellovibrionales bacterium]